MIPENIEENLHYIEFFTRRKIQNPLVGNHVSVLRGHGYDFYEHKKYQLGDDIRKIDWNATARAGHPLIKHTHEEKDLDVHIVADLSESMSFVTGPFSKRELLLYITAALAYSALSDHVRVGFLGFTDSIVIDIEPKTGSRHLWTILEQVWDYKPARHKTTRPLPMLQRLISKMKKMSIVFLVSDFLYSENMFEDLLFKQLVTKHDLIPIIVYDPLESQLPAGRGYIRFRDLESRQHQVIRLSKKNRLLYAERVRKKERELIEGFYRFGIDFQKIRTDQSFFELLSSLFLVRRRA